MKTTRQARLYPTPEQATLLRAHGQEYTARSTSARSTYWCTPWTPTCSQRVPAPRTSPPPCPAPSRIRPCVMHAPSGHARAIWAGFPSCASRSASGITRTGTWKVRCSSCRSARMGRCTRSPFAALRLPKKEPQGCCASSARAASGWLRSRSRYRPLSQRPAQGSWASTWA